MEKISVEVFEEPSRPEGGHAVVRLRGVTKIPDDLTFRIKPVDSAQLTGANIGWTGGEQRPIATRMTELGAELVVGPEIVENPLFLPGTLTVIEVAKCGVRGEFLWPRIAPLARPKRRHLRLAKPAQLNPAEASAMIAFEEAPDASAGVGPVAASVVSESSAGVASRSQPPMPNPSNITLSVVAREPGPAATASPASGSSDPFAELRHADAHKTAADVLWSKGRQGGGYSLTHLAAAVLAGGLIAWLATAATAPPPIQNTPTAVAKAGPRTLDQTAALAELLSVGPTSPKGRDVRQANPLDLLEAADTHLHGPPQSLDKQEAAFLLRRYLAATLGEERTLWALTQLGSSYADKEASTGTPDYARARQLWQIAGTLGDPVAMCFLGALHEHGLGVPISGTTALQWYTQAKHAGGCAAVDDAIARVKK